MRPAAQIKGFESAPLVRLLKTDISGGRPLYEDEAKRLVASIDSDGSAVSAAADRLIEGLVAGAVGSAKDSFLMRRILAQAGKDGGYNLEYVSQNG